MKINLRFKCSGVGEAVAYYLDSPERMLELMQLLISGSVLEIEGKRFQTTVSDSLGESLKMYAERLRISPDNLASTMVEAYSQRPGPKLESDLKPAPVEAVKPAPVEVAKSVPPKAEGRDMAALRARYNYVTSLFPTPKELEKELGELLEIFGDED